MNLRDQFKKANLLSDKDARRLAHEARVERSEKGREALEQQARARQEELDRLAAAERARVRAAQEDLDRERRAREERAAVQALLAAARKPAGGPIRFYFATPDGQLPWLELQPREAQEVRAGQLCIVRARLGVVHDYRLLPLESCRRLARVLPELIVHSPRGVVP